MTTFPNAVELIIGALCIGLAVFGVSLPAFGMAIGIWLITPCRIGYKW